MRPSPIYLIYFTHHLNNYACFFVGRPTAMLRHYQNISNRGVYGDEQLQVALQMVKYGTPFIRVSKQLGINKT